MASYFWQGPRLELRPPTLEDWEAHYANYRDTFARFLVDGEVELPVSPEQGKQIWADFIDPKATHGRLIFVMEEAATGRNVGGFNINSVDHRNGTFSIGMQVNPDARGQGYGTEAMELALRYCFQELRLHKCNSAYTEGNAGSARMHEKLGFVMEGIRREVLYHDGRYWNEVLCGLTRAEYLARVKNRGVL